MTGTRDASSGATAATPDRLDAIARKYRALVALRARRDGGGAPPPRAERPAHAAGLTRCVRGLAPQGPGALGGGAGGILVTAR